MKRDLEQSALIEAQDPGRRAVTLIAFDGGNTTAPAKRRPASRSFRSELTVVRTNAEIFHRCGFGREYRVVQRDPGACSQW